MSAVEGVVGAEGDEVVDPTRVRLLDAAAAVFAEKGYDGAGVQEIARRAGLTTGAIYGRFSGKAELLREAIAQCTSDELDELFAQHRFEGHASDIVGWPAPTSSTAPTPTPSGATPCCSRRSSPPAATPRSATPSAALMDERADRLGARCSRRPRPTARSTPPSTPPVLVTLLPRRRPRVPDLRGASASTCPQPGPWEQLITRLVAAVATPNDQLPPPEGA